MLTSKPPDRPGSDGRTIPTSSRPQPRLSVRSRRNKRAQAPEPVGRLLSHRADRLVEVRCDPRLGVPAVVGKLDDRALLGREGLERVLDRSPLVARPGKPGDHSARGLHGLLLGLLSPEPAASKKIDCAAMDERQNPVVRAALTALKRGGGLPDRDEAGSNGFLRKTRVAKYAERESVGSGATRSHNSPRASTSPLAMAATNSESPRTPSGGATMCSRPVRILAPTVIPLLPCDSTRERPSAVLAGKGQNRWLFSTSP